MQAERQFPASARDSAFMASDRLSSAQARVHVVGVAGTGLRGLVHLLHERGITITGSELLESPVLQKFRGRGIECRVGHATGNVDRRTNLVLISAAVNETNPEVVAARALSIPVLKYSELLGRLMAEKVGVAVAGTHGKTTTTAMVSLVLREAGLDPSFLIGGEYPALGGSSHWGGGRHFVAEACEYDRSFLNLRPKVSLVTNIEEDHLDYFASLKEIQSAFSDFVSLLPEDGFLVVNRDDPNSSYLSEFCRSPVGTFSLRRGAAEWWPESVVCEGGGTRFRIVRQDGEACKATLRVPGPHNVLNALAATAVCRHIGVPLETIAKCLEAFTGVRRRFDILARGRIVVVDDYAHHPTEIFSVLRAARESLRGRRLIAVFQPHQHSRLKVFGRQFAEVLARFDAAVVASVYRARDNDEDARTVQSDRLAETINRLESGAPALHAPTFNEVMSYLRAEARDGDAVIFMGAGDITDLAKRYAEEVGGTRAD